MEFIGQQLADVDPGRIRKWRCLVLFLMVSSFAGGVIYAMNEVLPLIAGEPSPLPYQPGYPFDVMELWLFVE